MNNVYTMYAAKSGRLSAGRTGRTRDRVIKAERAFNRQAGLTARRRSPGTDVLQRAVATLHHGRQGEGRGDGFDL